MIWLAGHRFAMSLQLTILSQSGTQRSDMFTISAQFMRYRGSGEGRDGVVALTLTDNRKESGDYRRKREIRLDISGKDKSVIEAHKPEIIAKLRLLYCAIERRATTGMPLTLDDIVSDYRGALGGKAESAAMTAGADVQSPLRSDLVSVGREFRGCFEYFHPTAEGNPDSLSDYIDARISRLKNEGKSSRQRTYEATLSKIREFTGMKELDFKRVDRNFIEDFADWLRKGKITESTQSFYLRTLRSILNHACEEGLTDCRSDLFRGIGTRIIFDRTAGKDALRLGRETLKEIRQLDLSGDSRAALVRDMFMFGFYCHGMELVDIAYLTRENVSDGFLVYRRRKAGKEIRVPLDPDALRIIRQYEPSGSRYLFPLLYDDGRVLFDSMRSYVQTVIKKIGTAAGFPSLSFSMNITAYKNVLSQCPVSRLL